MTMPDVTDPEPTVVASIAELLAGVTHREPLDAADGKSGNHLERVVIDGERFIVKHQTMGQDWIMRITGDRVFWPFSLCRAGLYAQVPPSIDHTIVAMAHDDATSAAPARLAILMRDVGEHLVPEGDDPVSVADNAGLLADMAALHARFWGWQDDIGVSTMHERVSAFRPASIAPELERGDVPVPIRVAHEGWNLLPTVAPALHALVAPLHDDPTPLVDALGRTPTTFLHGDWKMGNLGRHPDGRTILLDWAYPGAGPACWDLVWYLALNRARLPETKEACIERYRLALDGQGIETAGWFDAQLALCFVAIMVMFAWEKAVGDADELAWWQDRALAGAAGLTV